MIVLGNIVAAAIVPTATIEKVDNDLYFTRLDEV